MLHQSKGEVDVVLKKYSMQPASSLYQSKKKKKRKKMNSCTVI